MKIVIPVKLIPDLVEELAIDESGKALDTDWMRLILNEFDDHAIEQAILLKEKNEAEVIVLAPDVEGADDVLFTAAAKGADRLIRLAGLRGQEVNNHALARALAPIIKDLKPDMVLTGVQAHNDIDGQLGPILAEFLSLPYIGYVSGVAIENGKALTQKEYPGGLIARMEAALPVVLGIQAAEEPPRYIAFSKVRQARNTSTIEEVGVSDLDTSGGPTITRIFQPERGERAQFLTGSLEEISAKMIKIFKEQGVI